MGIEPTSKAWEAFVLPLNYTRLCDSGAGRWFYPGNALNTDDDIVLKRVRR